MPRFSSIALIAALAAPLPAAAGEPYAMVESANGTVKAPLFSEQYASLAVARVDSDAVTLREFSEALAEIHSTHDAEKAGRKDFKPVLDRIIGARLIALEAHEMGLDELPEIKKAVAEYERLALRDVLVAQVTKAVVPDKNQADIYYREAVREWKIRALLFSKEADAKATAAAIAGGTKFEDAIAQAVATKKGTSTPSDDYVKADKMLPQVVEAAGHLFTGQVSDVVKVADGFAIFRVEDVRYPENQKERDKADARSLDEQRSKALKAWYETLVKKVVKTDSKALEKLDFQVKNAKAFEKLEKDRRVLSRVQDEKDITVAEVAQGVRESFFHGIDDPLKEKRINDAKYPVFNKLLSKRVTTSEAKRRKIEQSDGYRRAIAEYRESLVFGAFVEKAILPGLKVSEEEGKAYYAKHAAEFSVPAMYKLQSLSFPTPKQAQSAYEKLKAGTDFNWLKANADKQIPEDNRAIDFNNSTVSAKSLPDTLAALLKGTRPGDLRLYAVDNQHSVLRVVSSVPEQQQPYVQVREAIAKKLSGEKVNEALAEWVSRLRKAHDVKVYVSQVGS